LLSSSKIILQKTIRAANKLTETILITGASGNIGSEVIKQLSAANKDLTLRAAAHSRGFDSCETHRLEFIEMDYDKPESIADALKSVDRVFLLTPIHPRMIEFTSNLLYGLQSCSTIPN
jgi:uncharacterized protein YbjT (DUF2867 family)